MQLEIHGGREISVIAPRMTLVPGIYCLDASVQLQHIGEYGIHGMKGILIECGALNMAPLRWYHAGNTTNAWKVGFIGTPNQAGTVTMYYTRIPDEITIETDAATATESILPQAWDLAIVERALEIGKSLSNQCKLAMAQLPFARQAAITAAGSRPGTKDHVHRLAGFGSK